VEIKFTLIIASVIALFFKISIKEVLKMTMNMMKCIMTLEFAVGVETGSLLLCYNSYGERVNFGSACGGNDEVRFLISTFSNLTLRCLFGSDNTLTSGSVFCDAGGGLG